MAGTIAVNTAALAKQIRELSSIAAECENCAVKSGPDAAASGESIEALQRLEGEYELLQKALGHLARSSQEYFQAALAAAIEADKEAERQFSDA
ncbi:hypothetical protein KIM372_06310 [Bombiscardovia nodaiensis]|uniref:PE family protein n=1 Tax=Bombiscardovia nodaiensis TaxID=2932181 RepID=A0ABN6S9B2_9BIFI|nr:hypothetical protein KIM372_06310 [Bombiscardovia nodaiensis]